MNSISLEARSPTDYSEYDSEDDMYEEEEKQDLFCSGCRNVTTHQRSFNSFSNRKLSYSALNLPESFDASDVGNFIGIDFGGTLTKVVFFQPDQLPETAKTITKFVFGASKYGKTGERDLHLSFKSKRLKGTFHFIRFQTSRTMGALEMLKGLENISVVPGTGGGAVKYKKKIKSELGIDVEVHDEFKTVVLGLTLTLLEHPDTECYTYMDYSHILPVHSSDTPTKRIRQRSGSEQVDVVKVSRPIKRLFPFLIVNIGSGVSVLKVLSPHEFERVSGTALGGATFLGLCKLLTKCEDFDEAMRMAERGDDRNLNLLVEDIYGGPLTISKEKLSTPKRTQSTAVKSLAQMAREQSKRRRSLQYPSNTKLQEKEFTLKGAHTASFFGKLARMSSVSVKSGSPTFSALLGLSVSELFLFFILSILCSKLVFDSILIESWFLVVFLTIIPFCTYFVVKRLNEPKEENKLDEEHVEVNADDISKALVVMISQNITQIAFMSAKLHNINRVVFTGSFLRCNEVAQITLSRNIKIWSSGEISALFMEHEGYFGALGSFLA